jgi:CheY-like chemotaxis protein
VQVSSELGLGSQFSVDLPAHAFSPLPAPGTAVQPIPDPSLVMPLADAPKPLLLLVDDNEANRLTLSSYLGAKGYRLEIAKTGREAVSMAQQHHPDLILMDIQMPDMDGLEAAQQIRADPALATTKIVALTALAMPENRDQCLTLGIDTYLSKPVKLKALVATVRTILNNQVPSP